MTPMSPTALPRLFATAACCLPLLAAAQAPLPASPPASSAAAASAPAVQVTTDPARAAAVLQAAAALKARPRPAAVGLVRAETAAGYPLLSGGVTAEDRSAMQAERGAYNLWVSTVARPSGAFLADVELQIERLGPKTPGRKEASTKTLVLQRQLEGPWLYVTLPPGSYEVTGRFRDGADAAPQTLTQRVTIAPRGRREAVLRFASVAEVGSEAAAVPAAEAPKR